MCPTATHLSTVPHPPTAKLSHLSARVRTLHAACTQVRASTVLPRLFRRVLEIGTFLNARETPGFRLDALRKLGDTRSFTSAGGACDCWVGGLAVLQAVWLAGAVCGWAWRWQALCCRLCVAGLGCGRRCVAGCVWLGLAVAGAVLQAVCGWDWRWQALCCRLCVAGIGCGRRCGGGSLCVWLCVCVCGCCVAGWVIAVWQASAAAVVPELAALLGSRTCKNDWALHSHNSYLFI
jgi:hypothetical protein